jgi:low affinity Fe/Cu permease
MGHPIGFSMALLVIVAWLVTGPIFGFSDTWQLVINTATTVVTFLMVFLIQNTQNRESRALQLKLDELIRAVEGAHNALLDLEDLTDEELLKVREEYIALAKKARADLRRGLKDTAAAEIAAHRRPPEL